MIADKYAKNHENEDKNEYNCENRGLLDKPDDYFNLTFSAAFAPSAR